MFNEKKRTVSTNTDIYYQIERTVLSVVLRLLR